MADVSVQATKVPAPPAIDLIPPGEKKWQFERRLQQHHINRGSRYPPFSIEPLPFERMRTATPMTAEDRFLRKQWLRDQILSPNEPRHVPAAEPLNNIRRFYRKPWDLMEKSMSKVIGAPSASYIRFLVPKIVVGYVVALLGYYQVRYHTHIWERHNGVYLMGGRIARFPGEDPSKFPEDPASFNDAKFSERKALLPGSKTSAEY